MIHSARATVVRIEICFVLLHIEKWGRTYVRTYRRMDNMCENNDHIPAVTVGRPSGSKE